VKSDLVRGDYERARRKSFVRAIASWLRRSDNALLAFEDMRRGIHAQAQRDGGLREVVVHTGQHYDSALSDVLFRQLGLPAPALNLNVGAGSQTIQTARIMIRLEKALKRLSPRLVLVYGDVNSTLAAAQNDLNTSIEYKFNDDPNSPAFGTTIIVPNCTQTGIASPSPCVNRRFITQRPPNYQVTFEILYLSGDGIHARR